MSISDPLFLAASGQVNILLYLLADLAIIIAASRLMGSAAKRIGQPAVIGEVLAGIILGPTILGRLDADWPAQIFPAAVPLRSIADLGLVFFMFLVGLELDQKLLRSQGRRAVQISVSGVVTPLILGIAVGYALFSVNNGGTFLDGTERPDRATFALFLGAAMCITAFPILARILVETGLYKTSVGIATLCAAAVDDVIAWILLAGVVGIVENGSPAAAGRAFILTAIFVVLMVIVGRRALALLATRYDRSGHLTVDQVAIIVGGLLLSAWATEFIGIHSIFGAFIFGAIMPKRSGMTRELTDKLEDFTVVVLLPVFFLVTGLRTDLFTLNSFSLLGWLGLILGAAVIGKFAGCSLAAKATGSTIKDSVVVGALMNTRGLTELVILTIGLQLGVLSDVTFAMMVIMALATTVMAAPIVNRLMPRSSVLASISEPEREGLAPVAVRILVAIGNLANAPQLVDAGIRLTGVQRPAELLLVRLTPPSRTSELRTGLQDEAVDAQSEIEAIRALVEQATDAGVTARTLSFISEDIGSDLARVAGEQRCTMLLTAWQRPSEPVAVVRAMVQRAFRLAPCDVAVLVDLRGEGIRPRDGQPLVLALSGGSHDGAASSAATNLAANLGSAITVAGYVGGGRGAISAQSEKLALAADAIRQASGALTVPDYHKGNAAAAIAEMAGESPVTVIGVGDDWRGEQFGSAVTEFANTAKGVVLVIRARETVAEAALANPAWPFLVPKGAPAAGAGSFPLPSGPHLQRLDPFGQPVDAISVALPVTIGRSADNRWPLPDDRFMSRHHAEAAPADTGVVLRDSGSTNGTMLWRDRRWHAVTNEPLADGDLVVLGSNVFRYSTGDGGSKV